MSILFRSAPSGPTHLRANPSPSVIFDSKGAGLTASTKIVALGGREDSAIKDHGLDPDIERRIALDITAAREEFLPDVSDPEADLRLVIYDYFTDEIAFIQGEEMLTVGLWLGYGRKVGERVTILKARAKKPAYTVIHAGVLHCIAQEILRGDLDVFRERLAKPSAERLARTAAEKERASRGKGDADIVALFAPLSSAIDEMVVSFREAGSQPAPRQVRIPPLAAPSDDAWPHVPVVHIAPHHFLMQWGVAGAKKVGLQGFRDLNALSEEEIGQLEMRLTAAAAEAAESEVGRYAERRPGGVSIISEKSADFLKSMVVKAVMIGSHWYLAGFPMLRPTHRLAASLMATHVPADLIQEIRAPFPSFFVEVPNDLVPASLQGDEYSTMRYTHVGAILGTKEVCLIVLGSSLKTGSPIIAVKFFPSFVEALEDSTNDIRDKLLYRLLVNMMIEADQPRIREEILQHKKEMSKPKKDEKSSKKKVEKKPEEEAWFISFRRDIKIDARGWVTDYVKSGGQAPSVQTLVRGHQKRQPHGPGRTLRKWIHVEPYWRGPEDAPTVVRAHVMDKR